MEVRQNITYRTSDLLETAFKLESVTCGVRD